MFEMDWYRMSLVLVIWFFVVVDIKLVSMCKVKWRRGLVVDKLIIYIILVKYYEKCDNIINNCLKMEWFIVR